MLWNRLFWSLLIFSLVFPCALIPAQDESDNAAENTEKNKEGEITNPLFERIVPTDRSLQRRYDQAIRLIDANRVTEAAQLLGSILENPVDFFVVPEDNAQTSNKLFGDLVFEKLQCLPSKAREVYTLQFDAQAKKLLENAVQTGSIEGIQQVARQYFPTTSGAAATFLLGMEQFEHGDNETAALTLQRLRQSQHDLKPFEPTLSLTLASAQLRSRQTAEAKQTVEQFLKRNPDPKILLLGKEPWEPKSADEIIARLETLQKAVDPGSAVAWLERTGWLLGSGTPNQNPETTAQKPLLELLWAVAALSKSSWEIDSLMKMVQNGLDVYIPASQPLIVGDRLLMHGVKEITAINTRTGKRLWTVAEPEYQIPKTIPAPNFNIQRMMIGGQGNTGLLRLFFWHDRITHQMSSDGSRLFTVDGLDMRLLSYASLGRGRQNLQLGRKSVEDPRLAEGNTLVARDVKTGRILWQIGKFPYAQKRFDQYALEFEQDQNDQRKKEAKEREEKKEKKNGEAKTEKPTEKTEASRREGDFTEEEVFLGETWYLGAPLPLQGRLYVIGENGGVLRLIVLDAETGRLIRQQPLGVPANPFDSDPFRKFYGLIPSVSGGILLCPTGIGLVIALDAATAAPIWCFSYQDPAKVDPNLRNQIRNLRNMPFGGAVSGQNEEFRNLFAQTGWQVPVLMIDGNRVLVAPPDNPALYCLELSTGKLLWQRKEFKRDNVLYVACIRNGTVYLVAPDSMLALSMNSGEPVWDFTLRKPQSGNREQAFQAQQRQRILQIQNRFGRVRQQIQQQKPPKPQDQTSKEQPNENQAADAKPNLRFPRSLKPSGIGVRNDNRYFLPLTDGYLGAVDLDAGTIELMPPQLLSQTKSPDNDEELDVNSGVLPSSSGVPMESFFDNGSGGDDDFSFGKGIEDFVQNSFLHENLELGNLIGIQGRFFSQTPNRISCFDQLEPLRERATARLKADAKDSEALLQLGRIRRAEGNIAESIALFRQVLQQEGQSGQSAGLSAGLSEYAADCLRKTLLEAVRNDYKTWALNGGGAELESLAEFPEELGEILFVLANGSLQANQTDALIDALQKVFCLETNHSIQVSASADRTSQLHRALGIILAQRFRKDGDSELKTRLNNVAETLFKQLLDKKDPAAFLSILKLNEKSAFTKNQFLMRPWWEQETNSLTAETRRLQVFTELFRNLPVSGQAEKSLLDHYERNHLFTNLESAWNPPVDWLLPEKWFAAKPPTTSATSTDEPVVMLPIPPVAPPVIKTASQDFEKTKRLAAHLESQENFADADYYYQVLEKAFGEQGKAIRQQALEKPKFKEFRDRETAAVQWAAGKVVIKDDSQNGILSENVQEGPVKMILRAATQQDGRYPVNQQRSLPFLGAYEPFLSPYSYALETAHPEVYLVCYDKSGIERWRSKLSTLFPDMSNYGYFNEHSNYYPYGMMEQTVYLKGCNHLLVFVRDNVMIAFDTFRCSPKEGPKILWTKTLSTRLPTRQNTASIILRNFHGYSSFPRESLFVSPKVVCYRDADRIYGIDPMTGQTIWTRQILLSTCSLLGDRENLFMIFPDIQRAVALDSLTGKELASGTIPPGGIFTFETNIIFVKYKNSNSGAPGSFQLLLSDLRELFEKRRRALVFTDVPESGSGDGTGNGAGNGIIPSIPTYPIYEGLSDDSLVRSVHYGRFLASVVWESQTLRLYDLQTRQFILGPVGNWNVRTGAKLPARKMLNAQRQGNLDFDVELFEDKFLVYFTESSEINMQQTLEIEDGTTFRRRRSNVVGVQTRPIGTGSMMLYDAEGNPCWTKPARIDDWFQLLRVPSQVPVALFAVSFNDDVPGKPTVTSTALMGIEKRTGKMSFRTLIPPMNRPPLQGFRVVADPLKKEISFVAPNRMVTAGFTEQVPPPPPVPMKELPSIPGALKFIPEDVFNLFQQLMESL